MSRMASHRRLASASAAIMAMTPNEATHQIVVTSHRIPCGGEASVVAICCSAFELAWVKIQHRQHGEHRGSQAERVRAPSAGAAVTDRGEQDGPPPAGTPRHRCLGPDAPGPAPAPSGTGHVSREGAAPLCAAVAALPR